MEQLKLQYVNIKDIRLNDVLVQAKVLSRTHWNIGVVDEINSESVRIRLLQLDDTTTIRTNIVPFGPHILDVYMLRHSIEDIRAGRVAFSGTTKTLVTTPTGILKSSNGTRFVHLTPTTTVQDFIPQATWSKDEDLKTGMQM